MGTAIGVEGLHKRYGRVVAADDVNLEVREGEIFGILGRNGAGKTTTVECVAGLRRPDRGRIRVLGLDPVRDRARVRQVLGVQLQDAALHFSLTVGELVRLFRAFYPGGRDPGDLIEVLGLAESRRTRFQHLSGGQQQRLSIALALVGRPRVAILDELTTGLDPLMRREIWDLVEGIRADGVTVVLVSHSMDEVERLCDRVAVLDHGRVLAQDTPAGLVAEAGGGERVLFRTATPGLVSPLGHLPEVDTVTVEGEQVTVTGRGNLLGVVSTALVELGVAATGTRRESGGLETAFLQLTGRPLEADPEKETVR